MRPPTSSIPDAPGSYQFLDADGQVLYVGKAKSLRHRLTNYWADPAALATRTAQMVALADRVEWVVVGTEVDALILEHSLIQAHKPRFNVRLKDDKSYPWLAVTVGDEWPRPVVFRGRKRKGVRYFGPYGHVGALRETLDLLLRSFPIRTCSDAKFKRHARLGRPCLLYDIERCSGPCVGAVEPKRYAQMVEDLMGFLSGETAPVVARLRTEMQEASDALEFERAARLRDRLVAVHKAAETQQMVSDQAEDLDLVAVSYTHLDVYKRQGRERDLDGVDHAVVEGRVILAGPVEEPHVAVPSAVGVALHGPSGLEVDALALGDPAHAGLDVAVEADTQHVGPPPEDHHRPPAEHHAAGGVGNLMEDVLGLLAELVRVVLGRQPLGAHRDGQVGECLGEPGPRRRRLLVQGRRILQGDGKAGRHGLSLIHI